MNPWADFIAKVSEEQWMTIMMEADDTSSLPKVWARSLANEWIANSGLRLNEQYFMTLIVAEAYKYFAHKYMEKLRESQLLE